jgi:hypothetical protein
MQKVTADLNGRPEGRAGSPHTTSSAAASLIPSRRHERSAATVVPFREGSTGINRAAREEKESPLMSGALSDEAEGVTPSSPRA